MIDAKEAERLGIVNKVLPPEELLPAVYEFAHRMAKGPEHLDRAGKGSHLQSSTHRPVIHRHGALGAEHL